MAQPGPKELALRELKARRASTPAPTHPAPVKSQETKPMTSRTSSQTRKNKRKTVKPAKAKTPTTGDSKMQIVRQLMTQANGCTRKDVLCATGWPAVSMQAMAESLGLTLKQEKPAGEKLTRYWGFAA